MKWIKFFCIFGLLYTFGLPVMLILFAADCGRGRPGWQLQCIVDEVRALWNEDKPVLIDIDRNTLKANHSTGEKQQ